jgi:phosphatidylglycerol:prolipoprotein diacylglycerol transferase
LVLQFWDSHFAGKPWTEVLALSGGGFVFYGGLLAAIPTVLLYFRLRRVDLREVADMVAPTVALGLGLTRIGCFLSGCCFGATCAADSPLAVTFPRGTPVHHHQVQRGLIAAGTSTTLPVHPVQLLASVGDLVLFGLLLILLWKRPRPLRGIVVVGFFLLYPLLRFGLECLRDDNARTFGMTIGQHTSILLFVPTITFALVWLTRHRASAPSSMERHAQPGKGLAA